MGALSQSGGGGRSGGSEQGGGSALGRGALAPGQPAPLSLLLPQPGDFSDAVGSCSKFVSCFNFQGNINKTDERLVAWSGSMKTSGVSPSANGERPAQLESTGTGLLQRFHRTIIKMAISILVKMMPMMRAATQLPSLGSGDASGNGAAAVTVSAPPELGEISPVSCRGYRGALSSPGLGVLV